MNVPALDEWDALAADEQRKIAERVGKTQAGRTRFTTLREYELGGVKRRVAHFQIDDGEFVLVPGGEARLGFDVEQWSPTDEERESWEDTGTEYGLPHDASEFMCEVLSAPRTVYIDPCFVEIEAHEVGWTPVSAEDLKKIQPMPKRSRKRKPGDQPLRWTQTGPAGVLNVVQYPDGSMEATQNLLIRHADVIANVESQGFRLPNADEWEHFCGAGTRTLFRWGDHAPAHCNPGDSSLASRGLDLHMRPNAFGLRFGADTYQMELLRQPGQSRGGDGGCAVCGGEGYFKAWLSLATSWRAPFFCEFDPDGELATRRARRVLSVQ